MYLIYTISMFCLATFLGLNFIYVYNDSYITFASSIFFIRLLFIVIDLFIIYFHVCKKIFP